MPPSKKGEHIAFLLSVGRFFISFRSVSLQRLHQLKWNLFTDLSYKYLGQVWFWVWTSNFWQLCSFDFETFQFFAVSVSLMKGSGYMFHKYLLFVLDIVMLIWLELWLFLFRWAMWTLSLLLLNNLHWF